MSPEPASDAPLLGEPLAVELMNTVWADRSGVHDSLATQEGSASWIDAVRPRLSIAFDDEPLRLSETDASELRSLREAARRLAAHRTEDPREGAAPTTADVQEAVATLNAGAGRAPSWPVLELDTAIAFRSHQQAGGTSAEVVLSLLAAETVTLFGRGDDLHLRACLAPGCVLYFVKDHPRRGWCSTSCGNRARAARHYARHGRNR